MIFSRFLRDCGRLEHAIINRRKTSVGTRMVHLQPEFEGQTPNESTTGLPEDNEMDPLYIPVRRGVRGEEYAYAYTYT